MLDFQAVGKQIHNLRVNNGYSQDGLAEILYVTRQAVSRWELGQTLPSVDNLAELCKLFHVSFEEILCMGQPSDFEADDLFKGHSRIRGGRDYKRKNQGTPARRIVPVFT